MKRLILADLKSTNNNGKNTGHYFAVARNYLELYSDICHVVIAGGPIYKTVFTARQLLSLPYDSFVGKNPIINKLRALKNSRYLFRHVNEDDIIVLQHSGVVTTFAGIALFAKKKQNLYVIQYDVEALSSLVKRIIYSIAKKKIKGFICPSERIAESYGKEGCIVTDYIYPKDNLSSPVPYDSKTYDVAIVGHLSSDKGVLEAVRSLAKTRLQVLVAGKADEEMSILLRRECSDTHNIELKLGFVSDKNYYDYIKKSRYCVLNYRGVYEDRSSGAVLDILFNCTPILGHRCKALNFVETEHVGVLFDNIEDFDFSVVNDRTLYDSFLSGIKRYLSKQKKYKQKVIDFLGLSDPVEK